MPALSHRPTDPAAEIARLRREVVGLAASLEDLRAERALLEATCHEDPLTGLLNRRGFLADLTRALSFSRRYHAPAALLLLDLDAFKPINDRYGHAAGDAALRHVGAVLRVNLRASDSVARHGGDEFAILLWQADGATARQKALSLEARLAESPLIDGSLQIPIEGSIGATTFRPEDDAGSILARADAEMYGRKAERRGSAVAVRR